MRYILCVLPVLSFGCDSTKTPSEDPETEEVPCLWQDADGDGYGDAEVFQTDCTETDGWVNNDADCDDGNPAINPNAIEVCDGVDQNCDGSPDENQVPSDYDTIQLAIESLPDGSTVCVEPGTYAEKVNVTGRVLAFKGQQGKEHTFLDLSNGSPVFLADDRGQLTGNPSTSPSEIDISGFTLTGTHPDLGVEEHVRGGLIYSTDGSIAIEDVAMKDVTIAFGDAAIIVGSFVDARGGTVTIDNVDVSNVYLGGDAKDLNAAISGGIITMNSASGYISNSSFENIELEISSDNEDAGCRILGGVLHFPQGDEDNVSRNLTIKNNAITLACPGAFASEIDGGMAYLGSNTYLDGVLFENNTMSFRGYAASADGLLKAEGANLNLENIEISNNYHRALGQNISTHGFFYFYFAEVYGHNWKIYNNELDVTKNPTYDFSNTAIGGGLKIYNSSGFFSTIDVRGNRLLSSEFSRGAGVHIFSELDKELTMNRFVVAGNEIAGLNSVTGGGMAVTVWDGEVTLQNGDIYGNKGGSTADNVFGVGLMVTSDIAGGGQVAVRNVNVVGNEAQVTTTDGINSAVASNNDANLIWQYNNVFGNNVTTESRFGDGTIIGEGNLTLDPQYVDVANNDIGNWNFELSTTSPCIDAGQTDILDPDGTRADIGSQGGPVHLDQ